MLRPRLTPCLLMSDGGLVKTKKFSSDRYIGDPLNAIRIFNEKKADELILLDIDATTKKLKPNFELIKSIAEVCRMPLCYGGGISKLEDAQRLVDFGVEKIAISSTKVRNSINNGDLKTTEKYLGRYFNLTGKVIKGDGLGKKIMYPTANIFIKEKYKIIPKDGVYLIKTFIKNKLYNGMMNIGHRPTIGANEKSLEVHLFNFNKDIYGEQISVDIISKIRDEKKFSSIEALKDQLVKDENHCLKLINK